MTIVTPKAYTPYRYRVGELQPVVTNREISKAFWSASRDDLVEDVEYRIASKWAE